MRFDTKLLTDSLAELFQTSTRLHLSRQDITLRFLHLKSERADISRLSGETDIARQQFIQVIDEWRRAESQASEKDASQYQEFKNRAIYGLGLTYAKLGDYSNAARVLKEPYEYYSKKATPYTEHIVQTYPAILRKANVFQWLIDFGRS